MKKKLHTSTSTSELSGNSAFFLGYKKPIAADKRVLMRTSFSIHDDQMRSLRDLAHKHNQSTSELLREAIDNYLKALER